MVKLFLINYLFLIHTDIINRKNFGIDAVIAASVPVAIRIDAEIHAHFIIG